MNAKVLAAFLLLATGAVSTPASAILITYTQTAVVSGSLNGTAFTDNVLTLTMTGDTSNIIPEFQLYAPLAFTLSGGGSGVFTGETSINLQQVGQAGLVVFLVATDFTFIDAPEFATYDLSTAFGPVTSEDAFVYGVPLPTSAGDLILDPFTIGTATFTATIPEPSTWAMMLLGFAGLGIAGYRRSLKPVSGAV